jgi:hypothetical protein
MAAVLTVDAGSGRFSLSLKPSVAGHHAGAYLAAYTRLVVHQLIN